MSGGGPEEGREGEEASAGRGQVGVGGSGVGRSSASSSLSASTRLLVLLGDPVAHSLSPALHNAACAALGLDAVYLALRTAADDVAGLMRGLGRAGGAGNVTVPHKERAAAALDAPSAAVRRTGACNTFWWQDGALHGENTDVAGLQAAVEDLLGQPASGARALVLGAGGAAAAAILSLTEQGAARIEVLARTPARARRLLDRLGVASEGGAVLDAPPATTERFDLVVNATPQGLHAGDPHPFPLEGRAAPGAVLDLVYSRRGTPWVGAAAALGIAAADGREMLLRQAAAAFQLWWRRPAPLAEMRAVLQG